MSLSEKAPSPPQLNLRCYKVGIFMAFFFSLKKRFLWRAFGCFLLCFPFLNKLGRFLCSKAVLIFCWKLFFFFPCWGFQLDQLPELNCWINTRVKARTGRSKAVSTSGWRQGVRDSLGEDNKAAMTPGCFSEGLPLPPKELTAFG